MNINIVLIRFIHLCSSSFNARSSWSCCTCSFSWWREVRSKFISRSAAEALSSTSWISLIWMRYKWLQQSHNHPPPLHMVTALTVTALLLLYIWSVCLKAKGSFISLKEKPQGRQAVDPGSYLDGGDSEREKVMPFELGTESNKQAARHTVSESALGRSDAQHVRENVTKIRIWEKRESPYTEKLAELRASRASEELHGHPCNYRLVFYGSSSKCWLNGMTW